MNQPASLRSRKKSVLFFVFFTVYFFMSVTWIHQFFPTNRMELIGPAGQAHRAFTSKSGFVDTSIDLSVSDWPHTFGKPIRLGDIHWPEIYSKRYVHWSKDGTVIALLTRWVTGPQELFTIAYDFKLHETIRQRSTPDAPAECDRRISALLDQRGGFDPKDWNTDDGKILYTATFPVWGWMVAAGVAALGGLLTCIPLKAVIARKRRS